MQIYLACINGKPLSLCTNSTEKISLLRSKVSEATGIPKSQFRLYSQGKLLEENKTIESYKINSGSTILLSLGLNGGGCGKSKNKIADAISITVNGKPESETPCAIPESPTIQALIQIEKGMKNDSKLQVKQGLNMLRKSSSSNFIEIADPVNACSRLIDSLCHRHTEGFPQICLEKIAEKLPQFLALIIYKKFVVSKKTQEIFVSKLSQKIKLVKIDRLGGPELKHHLSMSIKFAKVLPNPLDTPNQVKYITNVVKLMNFFKDPAGAAGAMVFFGKVGYELVENT